jgi:hypothetical protein
MSDSKLEKSIKEIEKNIDILVAHKEYINSVLGDSKELEKEEERKFEIKKIEVESFISNGNTYLTLVTGVAFSLFGVLSALSGSITSSLTSPTIIIGNFTNGNSTWTGELNSVTLINTTYFSTLLVVEIILLIAGIAGLIGIVYFHKVVTPKKINQIRKFPVDSETPKEPKSHNTKT